MSGIRYFAVGAGIMLLLSGFLANTSAVPRQPTTITLSVDPAVATNNQFVIFSGTLTNPDTGEGMRNKLITIYREGPMGPVPIASGLTGIDGDFSIPWLVTLERNRGTPIVVLAQFDGDDTALPSRTNRMSFKAVLIPTNLVITTDQDKNRYQVGNKALFSVAFYDDRANFFDPDVIKATYDGNFVTMKKVEVGRYTFETPRLTKFESQFGVFVEKFGYVSAQKSLTVTAFGAKVAKPIKVTASRVGDDVTIRVRSDSLNPDDVYTVRGKFLKASAVDGSADGWQFTIDRTTETFRFKALLGSLMPGDIKSFEVQTVGTAQRLFWEASGLHGEAVGSGVTTVRLLPSR